MPPLLIYLVVGVLAAVPCAAAPTNTLQHTVMNHETELRMFEEKLRNQQSAIDVLREEMLNSNKANKELSKTKMGSVETRLDTMEATTKGLIADFRTLTNHANDSAKTLAQYK